MTKTAYYMQMAQEAAAQITGSKEQWTAFLTTSARLYKYPFAEQLMIYKLSLIHIQMCIRDRYELIDKQFDCMAKYLSWGMLFKKSYYATARDELEKNKDSMNELEWIGKNL